MSDLMLSVGLAHKLEIAFNRNGWALSEVDKLCEGTVLTDIRRIILGQASIKVEEYVIDCDAQPYIPDGWTVEKHQKSGQYRFDAAKVLLWLSKAQQKGGIEGNKLRKELAGKPVLNANVLDYLLANPHLIPEEWKKDGQGNTRYIFFWGTVYRYRGGNLCVRYLYWDVGRWRWSSYWLGGSWHGFSPAALRAS